MVIGARQSFQFFKKKFCFLGNKRDLPKFKYWIFASLLHHIASIIKLQSTYSVKPNFY